MTPVRTLALVCLPLVMTAGASAQTPPARTITVNGQAEIKVTPDEVLLSVGVETDDLNIAKARAENDARVTAIVAAATKTTVRPEQVKTEFLDIQPRYKEEYDRRTFLGYFARRSLSITLRDVSRFEALLSAVLTAGANYVHDIDFRTTELRKHRDEARTLALRAAHEKATSMAAALNMTVGTPTAIQEVHSGWWSPYSSWWGGRSSGMMFQNVAQDRRSASGGEDSLVPGQLSVSATVSVTFDLKSGR